MQEESSVLIPKAQKPGLTTEIQLEECCTAPVEKGTVLGTLTLRSGGETLLEVPLVAAREVKRKTFLDQLVLILRKVSMAKG